MSTRGDLRKIIREAERQGWRVETTRGGHLSFYAPDGENIVTTGSTPSDRRSLDNHIARMRKYGFSWKGR